MRYLYICPTCKKAYSAESDYPDASRECLVCNSKLVYANLNKDEWDQKTEEEKKEIKESVLESHAAVEMSPENQMLNCMKNLDKNVATIKNILLFFTFIFVLYAVVLLVLALVSGT